MRKITVILLIISFLLIPVQSVAADDDVELLIKEIDNNTYSVKFNNQSWQMCEEGNCTVDASDIEPQEVNVDTDDLKMMAEFIAADLPNRTIDMDNGGNVNRSVVRSAIIDVVEQEHKDTQAWLKETYMPKQQELTNLSTKLASANQSLKTLDAEIGKYKGEVENKEQTIKDQERTINMILTLFIISFMSTVLLLLDRSGLFKSLRDERR